MSFFNRGPSKGAKAFESSAGRRISHGPDAFVSASFLAMDAAANGLLPDTTREGQVARMQHLVDVQCGRASPKGATAAVVSTLARYLDRGSHVRAEMGHAWSRVAAAEDKLKARAAAAGAKAAEAEEQHRQQQQAPAAPEVTTTQGKALLPPSTGESKDKDNDEDSSKSADDLSLLRKIRAVVADAASDTTLSVDAAAVLDTLMRMLKLGDYAHSMSSLRESLARLPRRSENNGNSVKVPQTLAKSAIRAGLLIQITSREELLSETEQDVVWLRGTKSGGDAGVFLATKSCGKFGDDSDGKGMGFPEDGNSWAAMFMETEKGVGKDYTFKERGKVYAYSVTPRELAALPADDLVSQYAEISKKCHVTSDWVRETMHGRWKTLIDGKIAAAERPLDFAFCDLSGIDLSAVGSGMRGASFEGANLNGCNLSSCDLSGANFDGARNVSSADLSECTLWGFVPRRSVSGRAVEVPTALAEAFILTGKLVQITDKTDLKDPKSEDIVWLRGSAENSLAGTYLATKATGSYRSDSDGSGMAIEQKPNSQAVLLRQTRDESSSYTFAKKGKAFRYAERITDEERAFHALVAEKEKAARAAKRASMALNLEQFYGPDGPALFALANAMSDEYGIPFWEDWNSKVPSKAWYSSGSVEGSPANFEDFGLMFCPLADGAGGAASDGAAGASKAGEKIFNPADPAFVRVHKVDFEKMFNQHRGFVMAPEQAAFPSAILGFASLHILRIDGNTANNAFKNMISIPENIGTRLPRLKVLLLTNIQLQKEGLPTSLSTCPLEEINLAGTKLKSWTKGLFASLRTTLRRVWLPNLDATQSCICLKDLETCAALEYLNASSMKALPAVIPVECFANKPRLQEIFFNGNTSANLPKDMPVLPALETIKLKLPRGCKNLDVSGLASCKRFTNWSGGMAQIPAHMERLVNLVELDISDIEEPWAIGDWIGKMLHLKTFNAASSSVTKVSEAIGECTALSRVDLHNNEELTALPASFAMLVRLTRLDLRSCKALATWPVHELASALTEFPVTVYLDGCPLLVDSLPLEWVASVRTNRRGEYEKSNFRCNALSDEQEQQVCDMHASTALRIPAEQIALWEKVTAFGGKTYDGFPIKRAGGGPRSYSYSGDRMATQSHFDDVVAAVAATFPHLTEFNLRGNAWDCIKPESTHENPFDMGRMSLLGDAAPNVTKLDFFRNCNGHLDVSFLASFPNVKEINFYRGALVDFAPLLPLARLTVLNLGSSHLGDRNAALLAGMRSAPTLTELNLSCNSGLTDIAFLAKFLALQKFDGHSCAVRDLSPLVASASTLTDLNVSQNQHCDRSCVEVIPQLVHLTVLALDKTNLEDITFVGGLTNLEKLNLAGNDVTDLSPVAQLKNLSRIDLSCNHALADISALIALAHEVRKPFEEINLKYTRLSFEQLMRLREAPMKRETFNRRFDAIQETTVSNMRRVSEGEDPEMGGGGIECSIM